MNVLKWLLISFFGFIALVGVGYLLFPGITGPWVMHSLFHNEARYYELTANLEVNGEPVEITRVIECKPYFAHRPEAKYEKRWYTDQEAMTQRLPDGSGVIVVGPRLCNSAAHPQPADAPPWRAFPDLPEDYVPLILWTADADNPEVLEGYHSFDSLERPGSRIRFKEISLRNSADLEPGDYPEEFGAWVNRKFGGLRSRERQRRKTLNYRGYYVLALERAEWEHVPELRAELNALTTSGFLEPSLQNFTSGLDTDRDALAIHGAISARRSNIRKFDKVESNRFHVDVLRKMHGVLHSEDGFVLSENNNGLVNYSKLVKRGQANWVIDKFVDIIINGNNVSFPNKSTSYYYDSKNEILYKLGISVLTFHVNQHSAKQ